MSPEKVRKFTLSDHAHFVRIIRTSSALNDYSEEKDWEWRQDGWKFSEGKLM
jgi:hypothetical protein